MTFHVGQKVVCVNASGIEDAKPLIENAVYTIREVIPLRRSSRGAGIFVLEIINHDSSDGFEIGYFADRFRPIVKRETDISFAQEILRRHTKKAPSKESAIP